MHRELERVGLDLAGPERVKNRARIFASPGEQFGPGGAGWLRLNFAMPRLLLNEALGRLASAFEDVRDMSQRDRQPARSLRA
jgi:bifunctional pyridoxal-dependent enzyme with beta-cystathionase and maltose regulon repressor activities